MAINFKQAVSANASSATITSTAIGDLIVVIAYNNASTTIPTVPAGYTSITNGSSTGEAGVLAFKISTGAETSVPAFTNATNIAVSVYGGSVGVGAHGTAATGNSTAISYPTLTPQDASGNSWVVGMAGAKAALTGMTGTTAGLPSNRTNQTTINALDTNGGVTSFAAQTLTVTGSGRWIGFSVEVLAFEADDALDFGGLQVVDAAIRSSALWKTRAALEAWLSQSIQQQNEEFLSFAVTDGYFQVLIVQGWSSATYFYSGDDLPIAAVAPGQPDEDYWQNPVAPTVRTFEPFNPDDLEELPAGSLYGPDEDFWNSWVAPRPFVFSPIYLPDPEELTAGNLFGPEEDLWINWTAPRGLSFGPLYLPDAEEISAATLFPKDEDYWQNPTPPIVASFRPLTPSDIEEIPTPAFIPDEDFALAGKIAAVPFEVPNPGDVEELPSLFGPEEDFWQNYVAPRLLSFAPLYLPDPEEISAGYLFTLDEDFWMNPTAPKVASYRPLNPNDVEEIPSLFGPEEEYVQIAKSATILFGPLNPADVEEIPSLFGPEEELPSAPQTIIPRSNVVPFLTDSHSEDLPILFGDEDFYLPAPGWSSSTSRSVSGDDDVIVPQPLTAPPEEDLSAPFVKWSLPYGRIVTSDEELFFTTAKIDEDYAVYFTRWTSSPSQSTASDDEILPQVIDEDYALSVVRWKASWNATVLSEDETIAAISIDEDSSVSLIDWPIRSNQTTFSDDETIASIAFEEDPFIPGSQRPIAFAKPVSDDDTIFPEAFTPDEDYWQQIVASSCQQKFTQPITDDDVYLFCPTEDHWTTPTQSAAVNNIPAPFSIDTGDLPLFFFEEDVWSIFTPRWTTTNIVPSPFIDPEFVSQAGEPDEDFWTSGVAPRAMQFSPLYLPDPEMLPGKTIYRGPDFWAAAAKNPYPQTDDRTDQFNTPENQTAFSVAKPVRTFTA